MVLICSGSGENFKSLAQVLADKDKDSEEEEEEDILKAEVIWTVQVQVPVQIEPKVVSEICVRMSEHKFLIQLPLMTCY